MKLTGKVVSVGRSVKGRPRITLEVDDEAALTLTDEEYSIEIKKQKKRRSLDANAYSWVLLGKIAEKVNATKEEVYRQYIKDIGYYDVVCVQTKAVESLKEAWRLKGLGWVTDEIESKLPKCTTVLLYHGSSDYDTAQMSRFIDLIVQDAKALGIETDTPEELARMKEEWR